MQIMHQIINELNNKQWNFYVTRKMGWLFQTVQILCLQKKTQEKYFNFSVPTLNYLILNGDEYYADEDGIRINKIFDELFKKDKYFFQKYADQVEKIAYETIEYRQNISNKDMKDFYDNHVKSCVPCWMRPDSYLESKINKFNISAFPQDIKVDYLEEPLNLLKIAKEFKNKKNIDKLLEKHITKYSWLKGPCLDEDICFTKDEYKERINYLINNKNIEEEIQKIKNVRRQNEIDYKNAIKTNNITGADLLLCEAAKRFVNLRTFVTENSDHLFYDARHSILKKYANKLGVTTSDICMMEPNEIISGDISKINERRIGYAIIVINGKITCLFGQEANRLQKEISNKFKSKDTSNQIKGNIASMGKVTGIARILLSHKDTNKLQKGEILVASMTTPDFVSAMEKASAFVTDEGGITCHAAIVAREFDVPCIVGTGNATKIIKDGDIIEVDANTGIVTLLK
jgi:phosphohistidine swiveling domain-containing protein